MFGQGSSASEDVKIFVSDIRPCGFVCETFMDAALPLLFSISILSIKLTTSYD